MPFRGPLCKGFLSLFSTVAMAIVAPGRIVLPSPGFEAPAWLVENNSREVETRLRNSHKEGQVTEFGYKKPGGASE